MSTTFERSESVDNTCPVCHDVIEVFAIGPCDHPVCYRCSTRMRVLCEQMDCPICRSLMPQVAFVYRKTPFKDISLRKCIPNSKYKIFYEDEDVEDRFLELLEFRCKMPSCKNRNSDRTFNQLQTHMRREHELFACDLCVLYLKIFPFERKFYNRKYLAIHRRIGDEDDKSYKGHPLCEFCDIRYNDKDELLKHLRKDHFFCHFCDQHGSNAYYDQYPDLVKHFSESHFLCTEGECGNQTTRFTHAFATEIDLKAHRASMHNKNLSKAQSREVRTIELDFQLSRRRPGTSRGDDFEESGFVPGGRVRGGDRYNRRRDYDSEDADLQRAIEASKESANNELAPAVRERVPDPVTDFPALNGAVVTMVAAPTIQRPACSAEDDFPTLSSSKSNKQQTQPPAIAYSSVMNRQFDTKPVVSAPKESKPVSLGTVNRIHRDQPFAAPKKTEDEYPSLGGNAAPRNLVPNSSSANWVKKSVNSSVVNISGNTDSQSKNSQKPKSFKNVETMVKDEKEFPSLGNGGGQVKHSGIFAQSYPDWINQNGSSGKKKPKEDKYTNNSYELPESYKSYDENLSDEKKVKVALTSTTSIPDHPYKPAPINNVKEFPGLPTRGRQAKVKEEKVKNKPKRVDKVKTKSGDRNACLGEIALALMQPEKDNVSSSGSASKVSLAGKNNQANLAGKNNQAKKILDWFDNPPDPIENSQPKSTNFDDNLSTNGNNIHSLQLEDCSSFPSLHTMSISVQQPKPPPGFSASPVLNGTNSVSAPPGFENQPPISLSIPAPPPGFSAAAVYIQPANFRDRNRELIEAICKALTTTEDGFSNFKVLSSQFRQGLMDASDYYFSCLALMGEEDFHHVFPELVALLPDISKQHELREVHQAYTKKTAHNQKLSECQVCGQVVVTQDIQHHQYQHTGLSDFPTLSDSSKSNTSNSNSVDSDMQIKEVWIKAK